MNRLFNDVFANGSGAGWSPAVDVHETESEFVLDVEIPGIDPEKVELTVDNGVLTIKGEKHATRQEGDAQRYHFVERTYGAFSRTFRLPKGTDDAKIEASHANGVLTIRVPKAELPQPKRITIGKASSETSAS